MRATQSKVVSMPHVFCISESSRDRSPAHNRKNALATVAELIVRSLRVLGGKRSTDRTLAIGA
jgi:hypothetical protein